MGVGRSARVKREKPSGKREQGASHSKTSFSDKFQSYLHNHQLVAKESLLRLINAPMASLMTWLVIGIALALPAALYVALGNLQELGRAWDGAAQISLYLKMDVSHEEAKALAQQLRLRPEVGSTEFISREQALEEFRTLSGYGDVLQSLERNPLPALITLRPEHKEDATQITEGLMQELQALPQVELAQLDLQWVQRLYSMMRLGQRLTLALALLLALGVLLVIGNTIRLAIESRRDEILIVKLVGGTNAFVRRPFLYCGFWYGLGGGIIAWLIISIALSWLSHSVSELAGLYQSQFQLLGLGLADTVTLWCGGALLGLFGAWLAVTRHLGAIEPR